MDSILHLLGLAKRGGHLEIGDEPVGAACRARTCRLLLVARDAADNTLRRARHFAETGACVQLTLPCGKNELGDALGRSVCAMAAVTDVGLACAVARRLARDDPEQYQAAADALSAKAEKALRRRREQQVCENKRRGKAKKPYVPTRIKRAMKQSRKQSDNQ